MSENTEAKYINGGFKVLAEDHERWARVAKANGMSLSEFLRKGAFALEEKLTGQPARNEAIFEQQSSNKPTDLITLYFGSEVLDFKDVASEIILCMITEMISKDGFKWDFEYFDCCLYSEDKVLLEIIAKFRPELRKSLDNISFRAAAFAITRLYSDAFMRKAKIAT
ncbi:hypothetical protein [Serratia nevei]|uniref:hypothetical protein n=1 Tax=Serratia nevei TaxID=2703794 RepID=UPI00254E1BAE|nr:hypothetical protein [Serratia nevei]MDK5165544.1 hypothetical protein [Serratia nevei]